MTSRIQRQKIELEFRVLDTDGNGVLEKRDYLDLAGRFLKAYRKSPRSQRGRAVLDAYENLWHRHLRDLDRDHDQRITREEYVGAVEQAVLRENGLNEVIVPLVQAIFRLVDGEEKDLLNAQEFARLMSVFGVPDRDSRVLFTDLDISDDGRLTEKELLLAFRKFYLSSDPREPANRLLGWVF